MLGDYEPEALAGLDDAMLHDALTDQERWRILHAGLVSLVKTEIEKLKNLRNEMARRELARKETAA